MVTTDGQASHQTVVQTLPLMMRSRAAISGCGAGCSKIPPVKSKQWTHLPVRPFWNQMENAVALVAGPPAS